MSSSSRMFRNRLCNRIRMWSRGTVVNQWCSVSSKTWTLFMNNLTRGAGIVRAVHRGFWKSSSFDFTTIYTCSFLWKYLAQSEPSFLYIYWQQIWPLLQYMCDLYILYIFGDIQWSDSLPFFLWSLHILCAQYKVPAQEKCRLTVQ